MMNKTEEIRAELDRLKIKWWEDDWDSRHRTVFDGANGVRYCAYEFCGILYLMTRLPVTVEQAIAAMVDTEPDEATMLKLHDRMNAALLDYKSATGIDGGNGANTVPFVNEMHQIIEDAAKVGVGTCEGSFHESSDLSSGRVPLYYCKATNKSIFIEREARFCPLCGRRIKEESE